MAVIRDGSLEQVLGKARLSNRECTWLWFYLSTKGIWLDQNEFGAPNMNDMMASLISQSRQNVAEITFEMSTKLLDDEYFKWISNDERQLTWLLPRLFPQGIILPALPPKLIGRERLISCIDIWNADLTTKQQHLEYAQSNWNQHKQGDAIFKWFKGKDGAQKCILAWELLCKYDPNLVIGKESVDDYSKLLTFFDQANLDYAEKFMRIETIKKRWNQQQYRLKMKGKKQYNFVLSDKANKHLDQLAETHELKRTQILEALLKMEAEKGIYMPEILKKIQFSL